MKKTYMIFKNLINLNRYVKSQITCPKQLLSSTHQQRHPWKTVHLLIGLWTSIIIIHRQDKFTSQFTSTTAGIDEGWCDESG